VATKIDLLDTDL